MSSNVKVEPMEHLHVSGPVCSSSANFESAVIMDGSFLLFQNEDLIEYELKPDEVLAVFKSSPNPARFVLDLVQASYIQHWKNEDRGLDASVLRSKILILEQLMKVSPKISPLEREAAKKLAVSWKENIRLQTENQMEVWAFLLFLAVYGLVSFFVGDEILQLIYIIAHLRHAPEICRILGFTAKVPGKFSNNPLDISLSLSHSVCVCVYWHIPCDVCAFVNHICNFEYVICIVPIFFDLLCVFSSVLVSFWFSEHVHFRVLFTL